MDETGARKSTIADRYSVIADVPGKDLCEVQVRNFPYRDAYGDAKDEVVEATVTGKSLSPDERCRLATQLATAFFPPR